MQQMAVDVVVVAAVVKLKLLAACGGGGAGHCHLHVALLWLFMLKLPFALRMRGTYADVALALRLFLFRLNRVLFSDAPVRDRAGRRWQRAVRLVRERVSDGGGGRRGAQSTEDSLQAFSMLSL